VVGYSRQQYFKEEILIPLGLNNTFGSLSEVDINDVMSCYNVGIDSDFKSAGVGMLATAEDVGIFLRALNDGSVFNEGKRKSIPQFTYTNILVWFLVIRVLQNTTKTLIQLLFNL